MTILHFVDFQSGNPLVTVSGIKADFLMKYSDLIKLLIKFNNVNSDNLTVPVEFPHGREEIFVKLMKGEPVKEKSWSFGTYGLTTYKPLSNIEEALMKNYSNVKIQRERENAIHQILDYLLINPKFFEKAKELFIITETMPLNDESKERLVEAHKNYLYSAYAPYNSTKNTLKNYLSENNIKKRNKRVNNTKRNWMLIHPPVTNAERQRRRNRNTTYRNRYNASHKPRFFYNLAGYDNLFEKMQGHYLKLLQAYYKKPISVHNLKTMSSDNFSKYLNEL